MRPAACLLAMAALGLAACPARAQTSSGGDPAGSCDLNLVDPTQVAESVGFYNLAYFLNVSHWGADELDVGDVNTTTCLAIPLPWADFVGSTGLTEYCTPSGGSSTAPSPRSSSSSGGGSTLGRKLKEEAERPALLQRPAQVAKALRRSSARSAGPLLKGTDSSLAKLTGSTRRLLQLGLIGSGGGGGSNSTNGTSGGGGGGSGGSGGTSSTQTGVAVCDSDFQSFLADYTTYPSLLFGELAAYFLATDSQDDTYGCMALFPESGECANFCVDIYDLFQSTGLDFPTLCTAAGLT